MGEIQVGLTYFGQFISLLNDYGGYSLESPPHMYLRRNTVCQKSSFLVILKYQYLDLDMVHWIQVVVT